MRLIVLTGIVFLCSCVVSRYIMSISTDKTENNNNFLYSFSSTSTWREYLSSTIMEPSRSEKWAWTCSLRFRSTKPVLLNHLILQWRGKKIKSLSASLYEKKATDQAVIPIQDNFICDGCWDNDTQQMHFDVNKKIIAVNCFSLLLSFSKVYEQIIKGGNFEVVKAQSITILE
jgi:hypothetical protein